MGLEREYILSEVVLFSKTKEAFGGLSNMASGYDLYVNEVIIPSSEHLYQAMRFNNFPEIQNEIIQQDNAMKAKLVSNKYKIKYSRPDWERIQIQVMRWALEIKLSQNWEKFSALLKSTGTKPIVEYTPKYKIWGARPQGNKLVGVNALGRLLMELRAKYVYCDSKLLCVNPPSIPNFLLYDYPIGRVCDDNILDLNVYSESEELAL